MDASDFDRSDRFVIPDDQISVVTLAPPAPAILTDDEAEADQRVAAQIAADNAAKSVIVAAQKAAVTP